MASYGVDCAAAWVLKRARVYEYPAAHLQPDNRALPNQVLADSHGRVVTAETRSCFGRNGKAKKKKKKKKNGMNIPRRPSGECARI